MYLAAASLVDSALRTTMMTEKFSHGVVVI